MPFPTDQRRVLREVTLPINNAITINTDMTDIKFKISELKNITPQFLLPI